MTQPQSEVAPEWSWSKPMWDWWLQQWLEKDVWLIRNKWATKGIQESPSLQYLDLLMPSIQAVFTDRVMGEDYLPKIQGDLLILGGSKVDQNTKFSQRKRQAFLCDLLTKFESKHQYLVILFFLGIWESGFPRPFAVSQGYVTNNGQWNISRSDTCPSEMEAGNTPLHNLSVSSISPWVENMEAVCWDDRPTAWITESSHGGQLPGSTTQQITDFAGASNKPYMFSCGFWGLRIIIS